MQPELPEREVIGGSASDKPRTRPVVVRMSDVEPESISWLWPHRIAIGKLHLVAGDGGLGKSTMTLDIAARVSRGAEWPDGSGTAPQGEVLILSAEDDPADTLRPRLDAANADPSRIHHLDGVAVETDGVEREYCVTLQDLFAIDEVLKANPAINLLIIDPIAAYLGKADSHVDAEIRGLLAPLAKLAAEYGVAVLLVAHLNKSNATKAIYRVSGSQGTYNAVRMAWFVTEDEEDEDKRLMLPAKHNITRNPGGLAYRLRDTGTGVAHVEWIEGRIDTDLDNALAGGRNREQRATRDDANGFLLAELADGPVKVEAIKSRARKAGIGWRTIEKAKSDLGVESKRIVDPDGAAWWWILPGAGIKTVQGTPINNVRSCGVTETPPVEPDSSKAATPHGEVTKGFADYTDDEFEEMADHYADSPS